MKRVAIWHICGLLALAFVAHFWITVADPLKRHWHYPGEATGFLIGFLVSLMLSVAAGMKGSRAWYAATFALFVTLVMVMVGMH